MTRPTRLLQLIALGATLVFVTHLARGAPSTPAHRHRYRVEVSTVGCGQAALDFDRVVELLRVELSGFDVELVAGPSLPAAAAPGETGSAQTTLRVTLAAGAEPTDPREPCQAGATEVTVRVEQATFTGPAAQRRLEISDVASANRARTLAIAAAELLQATWSNPSASSGNAVSAPAAVPAAPAQPNAQVSHQYPRPPIVPSVTRPAPIEREPGVWIEAGVLARAFPSGGTAVLGPELRLSVPLVSVLTLNLSGELSSGVASLQLDDANGPAGNISVNTATVSFGPGLRSRGPVALEVGPRLGLGQGRLADRGNGDPASDAPLVLVSFEALLRATLGAGWAGFAGIEVGRTLSGVLLQSDVTLQPVAGETPFFNSVEIDGVLIGARIGLSFALTQRR